MLEGLHVTAENQDPHLQVKRRPPQAAWQISQRSSQQPPLRASLPSSPVSSGLASCDAQPSQQTLSLSRNPHFCCSSRGMHGSWETRFVPALELALNSQWTWERRGLSHLSVCAQPSSTIPAPRRPPPSVLPRKRKLLSPCHPQFLAHHSLSTDLPMATVLYCTTIFLPAILRMCMLNVYCSLKWFSNQEYPSHFTVSLRGDSSL